MAFTGEEDQERVATKFEKYAAFGVSDREELGEAGADRLAELLSTDAAVPGEPFGQAGEARDVDEHRGRVDGAPAALGLVGEPLLDEARDERGQSIELALRARRHHLPHGLNCVAEMRQSSEHGCGTEPR